MNDFFKQQQELGREEMPCPDSQCNNRGITIGGQHPETGEPEPLQCEFCSRRLTLITQIITNTGKELIWWLEDEMEIKGSWMEQAVKHNKTIDTIKQHITNLTGVE